MSRLAARLPRTTAWVRLQLDTRGFDEEPHRWALERAERDGVVLTTMADLGDGDGERRALWALNRACAADMPERATFPDYDEYVADRLQVPSYRPDGVVVARHEGRWVGLCATSLRADEGEGRYAFSEITGVVADHRRRGLGLAMKLHAVRFVRERRYRWLRTFAHPDNHAAIALNLRLGYEKPPGA